MTTIYEQFDMDNPDKQKKDIKPDGYTRKKSETSEGRKSESELISPYHRDVNHNRNLGIV